MIKRPHYNKLYWAILLSAMAFVGIMLSGCTYTSIPGVATRVSIFQKTGVDIEKTSTTLRVKYSNDSQQAQELLQQAMALALAAGKVAK